MYTSCMKCVHVFVRKRVRSYYSVSYASVPTNKNITSWQTTTLTLWRRCVQPGFAKRRSLSSLGKFSVVSSAMPTKRASSMERIWDALRINCEWHLRFWWNTITLFVWELSVRWPNVWTNCMNVTCLKTTWEKIKTQRLSKSESDGLIRSG